MINLQDLERAFAPITEIGLEELTFDASGQSMTVRQVSPDEEVEVSRYARSALENTDNDASEADKEAALQRFLDRFKQGILCYAIVEIAGNNLRKVDFVATGDVLDNGMAVKIPKFKAIERIITSWPRNVLNAVYVMYGELSARIEMKAEKVITFNPTDLDAEIERLKTRLADLEKQKAEQGVGPRDPLAEKVKAINTFDQKATATVENHMAVARHTVGANADPKEYDSQVPQLEPDEELPVVVPSAQSRTSVEAPAFPSVPTEKRVPAIPAAAVSPGVDHRAERAAKEAAASPHRFENVYDSIADVMDENSLAAEEARLAAARSRSQNRSPHEMDPIARQATMDARRETARREATGGVRRAKKPPHRHAAETANAMLDTGIGDIRPATSTPLGKLGGVDTYRMPTAEISARTTRGVDVEALREHQAKQQSTNAKFNNPRLRKKVAPKTKRRGGRQVRERQVRDLSK